MSDVKWHLQGKWLEYCSCDYGCPCEAMAPPTKGFCDGVVAMKVDEGYYGDLRLDDLVLVTVFYFPRAIHHGEGQLQPIMESKTTTEQRDAIFTILSGKGQPPGTMFAIFSQIVETVHSPLFTEIEFEWDVRKRTGSLNIPNVVRATTEPIRNPVTDEEHHIRTVLPDGWTFYEAEVASGTIKGTGAIKFDHARSHCALGHFAFNNDGMAYTYDDSKRRFGLDG